MLSFCYCIRSRFAEVNIFENGECSWTSLATPSHVGVESTELGSLASKINSLVSRIGEQNRPPLYNQAAFEDVLGSWLTKPEFSLPNGSIVGLLCSKVLSSQLCAAVDADLVADFRTFLFTASLANSGWKGRDVTLRDLCQAAHKSGFNVISRLDHVLNRQGLIKRDRDIGPMLLLLILGVIIGVGYSAHLTSSPAFPHDMLDGSFQESPTLWVAMKQHLCQMLAHHLIFLGSTLGVKFGTGLEQQIIDTAVNRWNKVEVNMWADMLKNVDFSEEPAKNPGISPDVESATPLVAAACIDADELNQLANFTDSTPPQFPALGTFQGYDENPASFLEMSYDENPASYLEMGDDDLPEWSPPEAPPPYPGSPTGDAAEDDTGPGRSRLDAVCLVFEHLLTCTQLHSLSIASRGGPSGLYGRLRMGKKGS